MTHTETASMQTVNGHALACVTHAEGAASVVIFSHGFRGEKGGPARTFVRAARRLAELGIASIRFDQYGSGDSKGEFIDSRFDDWVSAIRELAQTQLDRGHRVALFGQSMGASAAICAATDLDVSAVVAWVPDASTDPFVPGEHGYFEEGGQRVANAFWEQAHAAAIPAKFSQVTAPCYLVFGTDDEYVSAENRDALVRMAGPADVVDVFEGYPHSAWTADQADDIIARSTRFLAERLLG